MRIPLMAGYHFDFSDSFRFYLFTGPELEIGFSAKEVIKQYNYSFQTTCTMETNVSNILVFYGVSVPASQSDIFMWEQAQILE